MTRLLGRLRAPFFVAFAVLLSLTAPARAQGVMTVLSPTVNGHLGMYLGHGGEMIDAGGPALANGPPVNNLNPGTLPTGLGIVNSGLGQCQWSDYANAPYSEFCSGFDGKGNAVIQIDQVGGNPSPTLTFMINKTAYPFPTGGGGGGGGGSAACNPVTTFGADPTGVADDTVAINSCAAVQVNGQYANVYLPAGIYYTKGGIVAGHGQVIFGDGPGTTTIRTDQGLSSSAAAIIHGTNVGPNGITLQVRDLSISEAEPSDQTARANFAFPGSCTSGTGGTGCKYPPAILIDAPTGRSYVSNVWIFDAWDGISNGGANSVINLSHVQIGTLDNALIFTGDTFDVAYWDDVHVWPFGIYTSTNLYNDVYRDGSNYCGKIGEIDGLHVNGMACVNTRLALLSNFTWGSLSDLKMDGNNATLEVAAATAPGLQINGVYATGASNGTTDTHCQLDFGAGITKVQITNIQGEAAGTTTLCIAGGQEVNVTGGQITSNNNATQAINVTGGFLSISEVSFPANEGSPNYTVPLVHVGGSASIAFVGNNFPFPPAGTNAGALVIDGDDANDNVSGNDWNGWAFSPPGALGTYYPNSPPFSNTNLSLGNGAMMSPDNAMTGSTALGGQVMSRSTAASNSTGVGYAALQVLTTGVQNTAVGEAAGLVLSTGTNNVLVGVNAMPASAGGGANVVLGLDAMKIATAGNNNVIAGYFAGSSLTVANSNTILGFEVGSTTLSTGHDNVLIGTSSSCDAVAAGSNNTVAICAGGGPLLAMSGGVTPSTSSAVFAGSLVVDGSFFTTQASPASGAACFPGQIAVDTSYFYACASSGAWKRAALTGGY